MFDLFFALKVKQKKHSTIFCRDRNLHKSVNQRNRCNFMNILDLQVNTSTTQISF